MNEAHCVSVRVFPERVHQVGKVHPDCEQHQVINTEKQAYEQILENDFTCFFSYDSNEQLL